MKPCWLHSLILGCAALLGQVMTDSTDARFCDPVTNVCYCTGGWDGADCATMKPLCEPGFWQACSAEGGVCSCTRKTWTYEEGTDLPVTDKIEMPLSEAKDLP